MIALVWNMLSGGTYTGSSGRLCDRLVRNFGPGDAGFDSRW